MQSKAKSLREIDWSKYIVYIAFVVVFICFSFWLGDKGFLTTNNILNITRQTAMITIMAVGMTFVIGAAQIDLSIGSVAALSSLVCALCLGATGNIFLSIGAAILVGVAVGGFNGWLVIKFGIPSFLATLGMMGVVRGIAMWLTNTAAVPISNDLFSTIFGVGEVFGVIPVLFVWTVVIVVAGFLLLNKTPFGKKTLATGGNEVAALFSGINTNRTKLLALTMSGGLAAFAGVLYAARMQAGRYTFGDGDEMSAIAAVILGGTALSGGAGSIIGALVGSLLMGMINNGLILGGLSVSQQMIVRGAIIILAVALSGISKKK